MMLLGYFWLTNVMLPQMAAYGAALVDPVMTIVITLAAIVLLFGAVGVRISNNLGSTIVGGIFRALGYIVKTFVQAIGWILRNTFRMVPRLFNGSRSTLTQMGMTPVISNVLAAVITILFVIVVI